MGTAVEHLVRVAGTRRAIGEAFQAAENGCGLDQYEVRRCTGWMRDITPAMLAHAVLGEHGPATSPPHSCKSPLNRQNVNVLLEYQPVPIVGCVQYRWQPCAVRVEAFVRVIRVVPDHANRETRPEMGNT
ncbi:hypothetical protein ACIQB5_47965 [Streptomyces sp. NPDC088560]|uniref:hypothetical protein n=1 Tax=Streptomyces sp. NPDC088560 TaxID=3365868 RepID=UPI00380918AA